MKYWITATMLVVTLASVFPLTTADHHWDEDREATYVGGGQLENAPLVWTCDPEGLAGGVHGVGGVVFCGVPIGAQATLIEIDLALAEPVFRVSCLSDREDTDLPPEPLPGLSTLSQLEFTTIGEGSGSATLTVPSWCHQSTDPEAPDGYTDLAVVPGGTTGSVGLVLG